MNNTDNELLIVKYEQDFGRMGSLEGLSIVTRKDLRRALTKQTVYFGEVLGKHSDIDDELILGKNIVVKSDDQEFIAKLREVLGVVWSISGVNAIDTCLQDADDVE